MRQLGESIRLGKTPGKLACEQAKKKEPLLRKYKWESIKFVSYNMITTRNRLAQK